MTTTTTIPCKRPKVPVVDNKGTAASYCLVPGCTWEYGPGVKTDVEEQATRHRKLHRAAVPDTAILLRRGGGHQAECDCGWTAPEGVITRTDNEASLTTHLSTEHGLVTCS